MFLGETTIYRKMFYNGSIVLDKFAMLLEESPGRKVISWKTNYAVLHLSLTWTKAKAGSEGTEK